MGKPLNDQLNQYLKFLACVVIALTLWVIGADDAPQQGWKIFSVFIAVIASFILQPFPMGTMVILGLVTLTASNTITIKEALSGYGDSTVWLVVAAFLIAGGVMHSGFGRRLALMLVRALGRSTLGLGYALCGSELLLGPAVPSNTARGGGIMAPIMDSLSRALNSTPDQEPERAGRFLALVGAHANLITASMFLTGMAANPLISKAAKDIFQIDFDWGTWALGSIVPGLLSLMLLPPLIYRLVRPTLSDARPAQAKAVEELEEMGAMGWKEWVMFVTLTLLLILWATKPLHGASTTLVAWMGVSALLLTRTESWNDIIGNARAWDALVWLGGLLTMANLLRNYGFIAWFAKAMEVWVSGFDGVTVVISLALIYFYSMYAFSMFTAHISAMAAVFLAVALAAGGTPMLAVALMAYFSCLCGCLTNYSSGPIVIYFGLGYVPVARWFTVGFAISIFHLIIWLGVGMLWWKLLGWW